MLYFVNVFGPLGGTFCVRGLMAGLSSRTNTSHVREQSIFPGRVSAIKPNAVNISSPPTHKQAAPELFPRLMT